MIEDQQRPRYWLITVSIISAIATLAIISAMLMPLFAPELNHDNLLGFPLGFYFAAQGLVIVLIVAVNWAGSWQAEVDRKFGAIEGSLNGTLMSLQNQLRPLNPRLGTHYAIVASMLAALLIVLALLEQLGIRKLWLSHIMIIVPLILYLTVSVLTRTPDLHEFFSVSRRIPPVFGGLAFAITAIGGVGIICLAGSLYLIGFDALALVAGWIAGFALASVLFVPFMRKAGAYTLPGFLAMRFNSPLVGAIGALLVLPPAIILLAAELRIGAFVTSLFASVSFEAAVILAAAIIVLVLVLGGLRSLSWTQGVQYMVALAGLLVPLFIISVSETNLPLPQLTYAWLLEQLSVNEAAIGSAAMTPLPLLQGIPGEHPEAALKPFLQAFGALSRGDFAMLAFCVLAGTAAMPALLLRSGTATNTQQSRKLVGWGTVFLGLFLISAPAYAVFAKHLTLAQIAGTGPADLPSWVGGLRGAGLADFTDRNGNGVISAAELLMSRDGVVLSLPIMAGLPFILVVFAATAGIAASLAAGAAHTFAAGSSISNDIFHGMIFRNATPERRMFVARISMVGMAACTAWYVASSDFDVLRALIAALSLAGASFFPVLLLSVFWKGMTRWGAIAAMLSGAIIAGGHMMLQLSGAGFLWPGLSGLLGCIIAFPVSLVAGIAVSLLTPAPGPELEALVDDMRDPSGEALFDKAMRLAAVRNRLELPAPHAMATENLPFPEAEPMTRLELYPSLTPFNSGRLAVSDLHEIYFEECGNPDGKPVLLVHGGPGGGSNPTMRRFHDPEKYRIILFDQRGCGRSTPHAELDGNTTWDLVADMERLREHLGIERWQLLGGSWGSTLSLAYAQTHPGRVTELILRGIFTLRREEIQWFYQQGCNWIYPDAYEAYEAPIPPDERSDMVGAYYKRLTGPDRKIQLEAARAWSVWEGSTLSLLEDPDRVGHFARDDYALAFARIECHYFINEGFLETDGQLIANAGLMKDIPGIIVHGRYDIVTPLRNAWELAKAWPGSELKIVPDSGHAMTEPGIIHELVAATRAFAPKN